MINLGRLGAGRIAFVNATAISANPRCTLVAISDIAAENSQKLAAQNGRAARTTKGFIVNESIDALMVAPSIGTYSSLIEAATLSVKSGQPVRHANV